MVAKQSLVCFVNMIGLVCAASATAQDAGTKEAKKEESNSQSICSTGAPEAARDKVTALAPESQKTVAPAAASGAKEPLLQGHATRRARPSRGQPRHDGRNFSSLYEAEVTGAYTFTAENCRALAAHSVIVEPEKDGVRFHTGSLLVSSSVPQTVYVRNARVDIAPGSIVFIKANQYVALVMNLHDEHHPSVSVQVDQRKYTLAPGRELALTNLLYLTYDEANLTPGIWYRSVTEDFPTLDTKVFLTQFSTLSTLRVLPVVRKVASFRKTAGEKIVKTAAAVFTVSHDPHVFRWKLDDAEISQSRKVSSARLPQKVVNAATPPNSSELK